MARGNSSSGDKRSVFRRWLPWIILAILGLGPLVACALIGPIDLGGGLGLKAAPDWSRGIPIGNGFYGTDSGAPLVVDGRGLVHLVWALRRTAEDYDLHYVRVDDRGLLEEEHDLNLGLYEPRKVSVLLDSDEFLHIFLLALPARGEPSSLFHLALNGDGRLEAAPTLVSSGDSPCGEYAMTADSGGMIHLFWTEGRGADSRLFYSTLSPGAVSFAPSRLLATGVSHPVARGDRDDRLHLLWEEPGESEERADLYHAVLTGEPAETLTGVKLLDLPTGVRFSRDGPVLAMDDEYGYLVWTQEYRASRLAATVLEGWYGSFALGSPSPVHARAFAFPVEEKPSYVEYESIHSYEYLVPSDGEVELGSEYIAEPSALASVEEGMVTCGMIVAHGVRRESQIINIIFADGKLVGYQLACNTSHWSRLSNLSSDSSGNLHLSWVDGLEPGPSEVYYASTAPSVRARVDHITFGDLMVAVLNTAFSAAVGVAMLPFIVLWIVPALIWVFISGFFLGEGGVRSRRGYVALGIGLLIYQLSRFYFMPSVFDYVPFSVSVPFLPAQLYVPLQLLVPVCIAVVGASAVIYALLRVQTRSLLTASLAFILTDAFLTMVVYGPGLAPMG